MIGGIRYRSVYMACKELGLHKCVVQRMLRDGEAVKV
jgi:hypothetical protein